MTRTPRGESCVQYHLAEANIMLLGVAKLVDKSTMVSFGLRDEENCAEHRVGREYILKRKKDVYIMDLVVVPPRRDNAHIMDLEVVPPRRDNARACSRQEATPPPRVSCNYPELRCLARRGETEGRSHQRIRCFAGRRGAAGRPYGHKNGGGLVAIRRRRQQRISLART